MIHEFALDPALAAQWSDGREFQRYSGKFGIGTPRALSRVPVKHWRKLVWDAFDALAREWTGTERQSRQQRLEAILLQSLEAGTARRSSANDCPWPDIAQREHSRRQFHAVLISAGARQFPARLPVLRDLAFDEDDGLWSPQPGLTPRRPAAMASALGPLLSFARTLRLVEPHFNPSTRKWRQTIEAMLARAVDRRTRDEMPEVEIHTCVSRGRGLRPLEGQTISEQLEKAQAIAEALNGWVPQLPLSLRITTFFWAERVGGPEFHDRFLLTDVGGLTFGKGFDATDGTHGADEVITVLPRGQFAALYARFSSATADFDGRGNHAGVGQGRSAGRTR